MSALFFRIYDPKLDPIFDKPGLIDVDFNYKYESIYLTSIEFLKYYLRFGKKIAFILLCKDSYVCTHEQKISTNKCFVSANLDITPEFIKNIINLKDEKYSFISLANNFHSCTLGQDF
jgi:hypothetical protein